MFPVICPDVFIILPVKVPPLVNVCPDGAVIPAFPVINPDVVIVVDVMPPFPPGTVIPVFALNKSPETAIPLLACIKPVEMMPPCVLTLPYTSNLYNDVGTVPIPTFPVVLVSPLISRAYDRVGTTYQTEDLVRS